MSLEKAIQKLTNAITTAKMDRSLMGGPNTPSMITKENYGPVTINGQTCTCVKKEIYGQGSFCTEAMCGDTRCGLVFQENFFGWDCAKPPMHQSQTVQRKK